MSTFYFSPSMLYHFLIFLLLLVIQLNTNSTQKVLSHDSSYKKCKLLFRTHHKTELFQKKRSISEFLYSKISPKSKISPDILRTLSSKFTELKMSTTNTSKSKEPSNSTNISKISKKSIAKSNHDKIPSTKLRADKRRTETTQPSIEQTSPPISTSEIGSNNFDISGTIALASVVKAPQDMDQVTSNAKRLFSRSLRTISRNITPIKESAPTTALTHGSPTPQQSNNFRENPSEQPNDENTSSTDILDVSSINSTPSTTSKNVNTKMITTRKRTVHLNPLMQHLHSLSLHQTTLHHQTQQMSTSPQRILSLKPLKPSMKTMKY
jgi:hypothetical protein